eukprot:411746_1
MELDSNFSGTDDDNKSSPSSLLINDNNNNQEMTVDIATAILMDAVNKESMRDIWRSDISYLNDEMAKNEEIFKKIENIIAILLGAITDQMFDCWAIKTYLGMISKLISCKATPPQHLSKSIEDIKLRWSHIVKNIVAPGVQFDFDPSQQIQRCCQQILDQLKLIKI